MDQVPGGYIAIRAGELLSLLVAYREGIKPAAVRLYLASHLEAVEEGFNPNHQITLIDLAKRAKLADYTAQKALRELETAGLLTLKEGTLTFSPGVTPEAEPYLADLKTSPDRPVPIPRRILRLLASHGTASELIGTLAHLLRCLFINQGSINTTGFIKNELITRLTGLCDRAIQGARNWMKKMGFISARNVSQRVLNRLGGCFSVNLNFNLGAKPGVIIAPQEPSRVAEFAPPPAVTHIYKNNKPINHYVEFKGEECSRKSGIFGVTHKHSTLTDIKPEDLREMPRLEALYRQAVARKWLPDCENSIRNFVGAATRSRQVEGNPVKIFVGIVKKGLWHHVTQAQEERGIRNLNCYRAKNPLAFAPASNQGTPAFIPEVVTPRARPEEPRPERIVISKNHPNLKPKPSLAEKSELTPISELVSGFLSRFLPETASK